MAHQADIAHSLSLAKSYMSRGDSKKTAALKLGVSVGTLTDWLKNEHAAPAPERRGRPASLEMTLEEANRLKYWRLAKDGSLPLAVRELIADPVCRPETREKLEGILQKAMKNRRRPEFPPSLRKLAHITQEDKAYFRSKKKVQDTELVITRGNFFTDVDGKRVQMYPNALWESDDMSLNQPFRWIHPDTGREDTGRQTLCTIDVFSHYWLAAHPIGRERDAYRAEDIAAHFESILETRGMPYCWRLERGTWESNFVHGIKLPDGSRWGGVDELFHVIHTWKSRGKATIEGGFYYLQKLLSHTSLDIGRVRGEYDFAAREHRRAQAGQPDALARLWTIEQAAEALAAAMEEDNGTMKKRHAHGPWLVRANDLYKPQLIRPVPESEKWRLCAVKKLATVRNSKISVKEPHYSVPFEFVVNNATFRGYLGNGTPVLIAFHPSRPWEGCHIFNALSRKDARNRENRAFGEFITLAMPLAKAPQFSLSGMITSQQREAKSAVRTEFREIVKPGDHPALKTSTVRDGLGQTFHTQTGGKEAGNPKRTVREYKLNSSSKRPDPAPRAKTPEQLRQEAEERLFG